MDPLPGYDHWKTTEPVDLYLEREPEAAMTPDKERTDQHAAVLREIAEEHGLPWLLEALADIERELAESRLRAQERALDELRQLAGAPPPPDAA